jgi:UDP-N-acetylglucosamine diphosphorylase/glucosamine-1-phosphate N-acetyltransferase
MDRGNDHSNFRNPVRRRSPLRTNSIDNETAAETALCLYDDRRDEFYPFSFLRPLSELRCGMLTMRERIENVTGLKTSFLLTSPHLGEINNQLLPGGPNTRDFSVDSKNFSSSVPVLFLTSRLLPTKEMATLVKACTPGTVFYSSGEMVGYVLPPVESKCAIERLMNPEIEVIGSLAGGDTVEIEIDSFAPKYSWELIEANEQLLTGDFDLVAGEGSHSRGLHTSVIQNNPENICISKGALIGPHVVLDASAGPIMVEEGANVLPFSYVEGPVYIGRGSIVCGAAVKKGTTIGPECRVGGEIECTIFQGYANKAHDGFLGHSFVGEWVNLGAGTTNSDLKNNYNPVRITIGNEVYDTGMQKMGALIGDHVKTGIGTLIDTGGVLGTGCNVFGGGVQPKFIPPFVWGGSGRYEEYRLEAFLKTAEEVMRRRKIAFPESQRGVLEAIYEMSGSERADWLKNNV